MSANTAFMVVTVYMLVMAGLVVLVNDTADNARADEDKALWQEAWAQGYCTSQVLTNQSTMRECRDGVATALADRGWKA